MARRSAAQQKPEPASLPEVLVSPSQAAPNEKDAYWLELIQEPGKLKAAIATEDFWPMLRKFPDSLWTDGRLSLYLYRRPDDEGLMIKNPEGAKKYIKVLHQPVDEEWVSKNYGGGKYTLYLKLDSDLTIRECTFPIDGPPKVKSGQVIELDGKPVAVSPAAAPPTSQPSETAQIITAQSAAAQASVELVKEGVKGVMEMQNDLTRKQLGLDGQQKDPLDTLKTLLEIVNLQRPAAAPPAADPMTTALTLMDKMDTMIERRMPKAAEVETHEKETPLDDAIGMVEKVTGKELKDILKGSKVAADTEYAWVAPIANFGIQALAALPNIINQMRQARQEDFERAIYLRSLQPGQAPPPPQPTTALPPTPPGPRAVQPPSTPGATGSPTVLAVNDPSQVVNLMVGKICQGFDRHRDTGDDIAAAVCVEFGDAIEALGLDKILSDPVEVKKLIEGIPALKQRSTDARWAPFEEEFADYMQTRYGMPGAESADTQPEKPGPQPVA
jgi:hypothetical protein